jgi:glycosyltransferase involved in cell wall biosynthesis
MELSIVIPTIRIKNINACIKSICNEKNKKFKFEILIINNSKNLNEKFDLLKELANFKIRYFHVKNQGATEARHIGLIYSKSDIISFIDDDIIVSDTWLETIINTFKINPQIGLIGGPAIAITKNPEDNLFLERLKKRTIYKNGYINVWHSLIDLKKDIYNVNPNYIFAQNFTVRKDVFKNCNYFNADRYENKNFELYGDCEFGFSQIFKKNNYIACYAQKALVYHVIDKSRISTEYLIERSKIEGIVISYSDIRKNGKINLFKLYLIKIIFNIMKFFFEFYRYKINYFNKFFFLKYYIWHQERVLKNNNLLNWIKKKNYMLEISEIMIIDKIDS